MIALNGWHLNKINCQ